VFILSGSAAAVPSLIFGEETKTILVSQNQLTATIIAEKRNSSNRPKPQAGNTKLKHE
jgi:hypothetical protein